MFIVSSLGKKLLETVLLVAAVGLTEIAVKVVDEKMTGGEGAGGNGPTIIPQTHLTVNIGNKANHSDFNISAKMNSENTANQQSLPIEFEIQQDDQEELEDEG